MALCWTFLQYVHVSLTVRSPQLDPGLQTCPRQCGVEGKDLYLLAKHILTWSRTASFTIVSGVARFGWCGSQEEAPLRGQKMWAKSRRRTSHNVGSSSQREVAMVAEVRCLFSHFSATSQKGVSSAVPVILCKLDHKWLEWPKLWVGQQGFGWAPCEHQPEQRSHHGITVQGTCGRAVIHSASPMQSRQNE